ncbi:MAG: VOC family protein [Thermoanaerobaculia bacterium]
MTTRKDSAAADGPASAATAVDHLLLGIADLDRGIDWVEKTTGVRAAVGGTHPGMGTRNALLSLGGRRYLEIIAPDPAQKEFRFSIDVRKLAEPRLITWSAGTTDIEGLAKKARSAGLEVFGPRDGSRARPDGRTLAWKTFGIRSAHGADGVEPIPFFIQWDAGSVHPSQDSPAGCDLEELALEHPRPAEVAATLEKLGIRAQVKTAEKARLTARLRTPKGTVRLS